MAINHHAERSPAMARKSTAAQVPVTRETATLLPVFTEIRDYSEGGDPSIVAAYGIHPSVKEKGTVKLGEVARDLTATDPKSGKPITAWTAKVGGKGTGLPSRTVTRHSRAAATMAAIKGAWVAN
jgi:hypothetical protein